MNAELRTLVCPRCQRANPMEARFCHYDGAELRAIGAAHGAGELPRWFFFPTGRWCKTFDELIVACSEEWDAAREMLKQGSIRQFMVGLGRIDLARAAQQAAEEPDADVGLDRFLAQLPTREANGPKLDLLPRRLFLGKLTVGQVRQYALTIFNQGSRLLHGSIHVEGAEWIKVGPGMNGEAPIKTGKQQQFTLIVDTRGLPAGQRYSAKLTVITNGGAVEVPITMELAPIPFAHAPLQGATDPRDLAARMKDSPRESAPLLENEEVQRWFQVNGWNYPVQAQQAHGVAAVQQFFEGMGLSKVPPLVIAEPDITVVCPHRSPAHGRVTVRTDAKKWIYAWAESDNPWLTVLTPEVSGPQQAVIEFEVSPRELVSNRRHEAQLTIIGNAGQKITAHVYAEVRPRPASTVERLLRAVLVGMFAALLFRFIMSLPDPFTRGIGSFGAWLVDAPAHYVARFTLGLAWLGPIIGGWLLWKRNAPADLFAGLVTGAVTGLAGAATLASALIGLDSFFALLFPLTVPASAIFGWGFWGAVFGFLLGVVGSKAERIIILLGRPFAWLALQVKLPGLAEWLGWES